MTKETQGAMTRHTTIQYFLDHIPTLMVNYCKNKVAHTTGESTVLLAANTILSIVLFDEITTNQIEDILLSNNTVKHYQKS